MKKHTPLLILLLIAILSSQSVVAQFKFSNLFGSKEKPRKNRIFEPTSTVSLGFGTSSYYGDLSPYGRIIQSTEFAGTLTLISLVKFHLLLGFVLD